MELSWKDCGPFDLFWRKKKKPLVLSVILAPVLCGSLSWEPSSPSDSKITSLQKPNGANLAVTMTGNETNPYKKDVFVHIPLVRVPPANLKEEGLVSSTATSHQVAA